MSDEKKALVSMETGVEDECSLDSTQSTSLVEDSTQNDSSILSIHGLRTNSNMEAHETDPPNSSLCVRIIKFTVLVWLALQTAIHILVMRYSRARVVSEMFFPSVAVFFTEVFKFIFCLLVVFLETRGVVGGVRMIKKQVFEQPLDTLKVCLPAMLYIIQNNLLYTAASHLDAATFMVVTQLKIFATAIFSIALLKRTLSLVQWSALGVLAAGVVLVQLHKNESKNAKESQVMNPFIGFGAAFLACTLSGFSGVFLERILKGSAPVSIWMRNVQMGVFSIPSAMVGIAVTGFSDVLAKGPLYGFDSIVWFTALWYSVGGLSVAVCIKYADNISKNFATSVAIILATIGSIYIFDFQPNVMFIAGAGLVIASIFIYSSSNVIVSWIRPSKN